MTVSDRMFDRLQKPVAVAAVAVVVAVVTVAEFVPRTGRHRRETGKSLTGVLAHPAAAVAA